MFHLECACWSEVFVDVSMEREQQLSVSCVKRVSEAMSSGAIMTSCIYMT